MKPRQRRVESFHGKTGHPRLSSSGNTNAVQSSLFPDQSPQQEVSSRFIQNPQNDLNQDQIDASKLKGWATVQDLTGKRLTPANVDYQQGQMSGNIDQQRGPMSSTVGPGNKVTEPHSYYTSYDNSSSPSVLSSKPEMNVANQSPQSPKSPNWNSSASPYSHSGFQKVQPDFYQNRSSHQSYQNSENKNQVLNSYLTDDYSSKLPKSSSKSERRSLPPQFLHQKSDYQNISELHSYTSSLTSPSRTMYPPKEEEECEPELRNMPSTYHPDNVDPRPPCSPPAPPVRDLSSLKYVRTNQSHEKYPSWPVTQPSIEPETSVSINSQGGMWQDSGDGKISEPKLQTVVERNSPALNERKNGDENKRNASDPGFKKTIPFKNFIKRPKHMDLSAKNEESRRRQAELVEDIFNSKPGYPEPKYDQDGHRLGDDKYSVPSPPERDMSGLDQKTLTEKIQAIVSPSFERSSFHQSYSAHSHIDHKRSKFECHSSLDTNKKDLFLEPNNNSTKKSQNTLGYKMVDSSTSPLQSPTTDQKGLSTNMNKNKDRPSESIQLYSNDRHRSYIVKQMLCYNTGTQTEFGSSKDISGDKLKQNVDIQSSSKDEQQRMPLPGSEQRMSSHGAENRLSSHASEPNMLSHGSEHLLSSQVSEPHMSLHGSEQRMSSHGSDSDYGPKQPMDDRLKFSDEDRIRLENDRIRVGESSHSMMKGSKSDRQLHDHPYHYDYSPSTAPMLRKLSQEYYSGRFQGSLSDKRMSSSSGHESDTRSPLSDFPPHNFGQFGELKEAESYNSVVIHPNENSLPFGRDIYESTSSESYMDYSSIDGERNSGYGKMDSKSFDKQRRSLDPSIFSQKSQSSRNIFDSRYSSEANLQSPFSRDQRDHSRSMTSLPVKKLGSASDDSRIQSSSSNQYMNSPDTRSSTSTAYGSENSQHFNFNNQSKNLNNRRDSDSVFIDPDRSPAPVNKQEVKTESPDNQTSRLGRNMSIKMAYGTAWMDSEQAAKHGVHKRQESDITSNSTHSTDSTGNISHGRSQSLSDYMHMDQLRSISNKKLGLIREDSLEHKLDSESYKKFKSGDQSKKGKQTFENFDSRKNNFNDQPRFKENMLKRTSSEHIRPMKDKIKNKNKENFFDQNQINFSNSANDRNRGNKSETRESPARSPMDSQNESAYSDENKNVRISSSSSRSDIQSDSDMNKQEGSSPVDPNGGSDIKKLQRDAVQNYMERMTGPKDGIVDDEHIYQDPSIAMANADRNKSSKLTPSESFRQKYAARRAESLRRSRSISSKDSSEYMEMKRPDRNHPQTEWSRIRSQTSSGNEGSKRPHSIGSDISLVDAYAVTPISPMNSMHDPRDFEQHNKNDSSRSSREMPPAVPTSAAPSVSSQQLTSANVGNQENRSSTGGTGSVPSLIYENVGYRRPPPVPPPPGDDEKPPALPPRNYRRFQNSQSDSTLINRQQSVENNIDPTLKQNGIKNKCENSPAADSYAQQLRIQARRLSEHQLKPTPSSMSYKTTKMQINYSQSYKRTPAEVLEATPPKSVTSEQQQTLHSEKPQSPTSTHSVSPNLSNQFPLGSQPANQANQIINSPSSNQVKAWQNVETNQTQNSNMDISNRFYSPESRTKSVPSPTQRRRDSSPGLPPPPTPIKNGETEIQHIDNMDLPPPPPEIINNDQSSEKENTREGQGHEGYADDSFGSYKSKSGRQIGVYKRSQSAGDVLKAAGTTAENIQKPPRKRLQQQDYKSEQSLNTDSYSSEQPPEQKGVPTFKASESVPIKSTAKPLQKVSGNSLSSSYLISPKPFNSSEIAKSQNTASMKSPDRPSVRDRIFNFEKNSPLESGQNKSKTEMSSAVDLLKKSFGNMGQSPRGPPDTDAENVPAMPKRTYLNSPRYTPSKFSSSYSEGSSGRFTENEPVQSRSMYEPPKAESFQSDSNSQTPQIIERRGSGTSRGDMRFPRQDSDRSMNYSSPKGGSENSSVQNEVSNNQSLANSSFGANRYNYRRQSGDTNQSLQSSYSNQVSFKNDNRQDLSHNDKVLNERLTDRDSSDSNYNKHSGDYNKGYYNQSPSENRSRNSNQNYSPNVSANLNNNNNNNDVSKENETLLVNHARQRSKEELECDEKVQEFAIKVEDKDKKLSEVLKSDIDRMRYMEGIFTQNLPLKNSDTHRSPKSSSVSEHPKVAVEIKDKAEQSQQSQKETDDSNRKDSSPLPSTYWVSPSKAMIEMDIRRSENKGKEMTKDIEDSDTLVRTKEQLVQSIMKKVDKLKEEKIDLTKEIDEIEKIGKQVIDVFHNKCQNQHEKDKFKSYIQDSEKIIRLLLKLSGLLARAENALQSLPENADQGQKKMATDKRDNYKAQHEEAKNLKEDIDKRSDQVAVFLKECLSDVEYEDYNYYVQMKSKLTIEMQELEDKLMLGEEQIQALKRSIPDRH